MPLTRYQIRNEYGLADPELFKAADKDDPEALLEGVAMAGLVGLLRQLGDLAEFAAEVFHDLHEEVISMSARGHGLMVRVQQLEADVPLIEKSFLSQTSHTSFFTNAGVDWHPNLQSEQSLIARGDLPRFVMDSYEECRGPPRLFLLDKFDVAGAGACLKRYTDPSVFKVEPTYERSTIELQREKKVRKVKKKGPRWRNGGTPDIGPTSHSKLHQLFLEERINSCFNDPSRIVKLKKRQFNGRGIDSKNGKSYMEKFLETPSPEHKMICETSVAAPTLHLMSDNTNELGLKILDITMVSPASKSPGRVSTCSSCIAQEEVFKSPVTGDLSGQEVVKMPESNADNEIETTPDLHVMMVENHSEYDGEGKTEGSVDGYHSDGVISEVDSYMDALGTMESEMETDNEHRYKNFNLLKTEKQESGSDANPEHLKTQAQLSDSQSFATSGSDEGNSSFKRDRSSFSCCDTVSRSVDNLHYDSEGAANALPSIPKACMVDTEDMPCNLDDITPHESKADGLGVLDNTSVDEDRIPKLKKALGDSCFLDSIPSQPLLDSGSGPSSSLLVEPKLDQTPSIKHFNFGSQISKTETDLDHYEVTFPDVPLKTVDDVDRTSTSERHPISDREGGDINVMSESLLHPSNVLCLADENEAVQKVKDELLQREYQDDNTDKQALPDTESCSSVLLLTETSPAFIDDSLDDRYNVIASKHNDNIVTSEVKSGDLLPIVGFLQSQCLKDQLANVADDVPQVEAGSADTDVFYSKGKANNVVVTWKANDGHADAVLDEMKPHFPTNRVPEIHVNSQEFVTETVHPEGITVPDPAVSSHFKLTSPGDQDHEDFVNDNNVPFERIEADDVVDSVNNSDVATEKDQADNVVDSVNSSDVATEKVEAVDVVVSVNCSDVTTEKVQADDVVTSTAIVGKTASVTDVTSKNLDHLSDEERLSMDKPPIGTFQGEDGFVCDPDPKPVNVVSEEVCTSLIGQSCTSANIHNDLLENHPGVKDLYPNQNGFKDTSEYSWEPVTENKVNQLEVASAPCNSKHESVSSYSDSGLIDGIHNIPIKAQGNSIIDGISIGPKSLDLRNLESESNTSHQRDLKVGIEFIPRPPLCLFPMETPKEPSPDMRPKHVEMELMQAEDVYNSSSFQQSIKVESPGLLDEKVEQVQCPDLLQQDRNSNYNACEETVQAELSLSQLPIHHPLGELNMTGRTMDTLQPALPYFAFLPEVPQVNVNEIPPLPPLPPMQWRLGKIQPAFPALPGKEDPHSLVLPSKDNKQPIGLEPSNAEILQPENPNFCFPAHEHDKSTHVSGHMVHNMVQISPSPLQLSMISNDNYQFSSATMDDKQSTSSFLTLPPIPKENLEHGHGCLTADGEKVLAGLTIEDGTSKDDSGSSYGHSIQSLSNSSVEKDLKHDIPQHVSRDFEGEQRNSHVMMAPVSLVKDEKFQHDLLNTEQEVASSSDTSFMPSASEFGRPNGNPTSKLLRPRSPLIDAVAAHDKSKLRKVSDRILPQIGPKVDERDTLLAQIRTKSFNLKPAVVTRPSVQGPKTNLNVAAILEKANAIRHAFAGSDEDDDTDSWGDSE